MSESEDHSQLHVLGREFPTRSGRIDILGTDASGSAYIVETKLYKNTDKRLVLAQVLDYGAALWAQEPTVDLVIEALRRDATTRGTADPLVSLATFLGGDEDIAVEHIGKVCDALSNGRFTTIVLMDRLDDRLRDLILFMNDNSNFRVLAVELDYYRHEQSELVYPRVFGAETRRPMGGRGRSHGRRVDPETYLEDYGKRFGDDAVEQWRSIEEAVRNSGVSGLEIAHFPSGGPYVSLSSGVGRQIRILRLKDEAQVRDLLHFNSELFDVNKDAREVRERFRAGLLRDVPGAEITGKAHRVHAPLRTLAEQRAFFITALEEFAKEMRAVDSADQQPSPGVVHAAPLRERQ